MDIVVVKRDGSRVEFDPSRITDAIFAAASAIGGTDADQAEVLSREVHDVITRAYNGDCVSIEDIQDTVERVLISHGHVKTARAYMQYRDKRRELRSKAKVRKPNRKKISTTDSQLLVNTSDMLEYHDWDKARIVDSLVNEAGLSKTESQKIARMVEKRILNSGVSRINSSLVRELVNNELFDRGKTDSLINHDIIGMSSADIDALIKSKSQENANISANNPEAVNLAIAENSLKQYALSKVFSQDVAEAHKTALVHLHDLSYPIRVYCSGHSLEYIKKYGLNLENLDTTSAPAKHARTLTGHLNTFLASMQAYYAGALGINAVNIMYAPYLEGMTDEQLKQEAQHLIFSSSQNAFSRGGQTLFIDYNVYTTVPKYLADVKAIGPKGKYTGRTYGDYKETAQRFLKAMLEVWGEGDQHGNLFAFPKMQLHISDTTFTDESELALLRQACKIASHNGLPYFVFDRGDTVSVSACCRLVSKIEDNAMLEFPERQRFAGVQNVTINLPQCAYRSGGSVENLYREIDNAMDIAVKAHMQKKKFLHSLMQAPHLPLWQLGKPSMDGSPYVDLEKGTYIIGLIGLNECVKYMTGNELHTEDGITYGMRVVSYMYLNIKGYVNKYGLKFALEESPAESASRRFARNDVKRFKDAEKFVQGSTDTDDCYYTNSIHIRADADIDLLSRIRKQSKFHTLIESGAIIHAFVGENKPNPKAIEKLIRLTLERTNTAQLTISPEFTICRKCKGITNGLTMTCSNCGSKNEPVSRQGDVQDGTWTQENFKALMEK